MFNIGPLELVVLAIVGLVVLGPDRLPGLARDAARMIRTLRELATGAREQLREELGPEFADIDLRNLNPRTAVQRAVFGDDLPDLGKYDPRRLNPGAAVRDAIFGDSEPVSTPKEPVSTTKEPVSTTKEPVSTTKEPVSTTKEPPASAAGASANGSRPRPKPGPRVRYDDAT